MAGAGSFTLMGLKEDGEESLKVGASAFLGVAIAKQLMKLVSTYIPAAVPPVVTSIIPIAMGVLIHAKGKASNPLAAPGLAAGFVAYGVGSALQNVATLAGAQATLTPYLPFNGVDTYDSRMLAGAPVDIQRLGYGGGYNQFGVRSYMQGAPTSVQQLNGLGSAPLSAQIVSTHGPMTASLM